MKHCLTIAILASSLVVSCAVPERGATPESDDASEGTTDTGGGGGGSTDTSGGGDLGPGEDLGPTEDVPVGGDVADGGGGTPDVTEPPISFAEEIHEILVTNCMSGGCHGSGAGGFSIVGDVDADYAAVLNVIVTGDSAASKLLKKASGTSSHAGGPVLAVDSPEYELIAAWIDDGANP